MACEHVTVNPQAPPSRHAPRKPGGIFCTPPSFQSPGTELLVNSSTPFMPRYFSLVGFEAKDTGEMVTT